MILYLLLPLLAFVINLVLIPLVLRDNRKSPPHQVFSLFLLAMSLWGFTIFKMRSSSTLAEAAQWETSVLVTWTAIALYYFHFNLLFTRVKTWSGVLPSIYVLGLGLMVLMPTQLVFQGMQLKWYGYAPTPGPLMAPFMVFLYALMLWSLVNTIKVYRQPVSAAERNRAGYLALGLLFLVIGGTSDYLPTVGFPIYPMGIVANVLFATVTTVAIVRHQLLDVRVALRTGVLYSVVSGLLMTGYILLVLFLGRFITVPSDIPPVFFYLGGVLVVSIAFQPVYRLLQDVVDKWFYQERYGALWELKDFALATKDVTEVESLSASLVRLVVRAIQAERACLLLPLSKDRRFVLAAGLGIEVSSPVSFAADGPLASRMTAYDQPLSVREIDALPERYLIPVSEITALEELKMEVFVPLKTRQVLVGMLLIGPKKSRQGYFQEDMDLLQTVCHQAATSIENARLYSELQRQLEELKQAQAQLVRSEKLAAIGRLAANVAHEVNNPLQTIINLAYLLAHDTDENDPRRADLEAIQTESLRARRIVQGLLDFARQEKAAWDNCDINGVVETVLGLARVRTASGNVTVVTNLDRTLPRLYCDAEQLKQVFLNIVNNALDAMPRGGTLTVRSRQEQDGRVAIQFADTGVGIPPDVMPRVFEPFFTTKPHGRGTGLGLAVSLHIAKNHGGTIGVESEENRGSAFTVYLPLGLPGDERMVTSVGQRKDIGRG